LRKGERKSGLKGGRGKKKGLNLCPMRETRPLSKRERPLRDGEKREKPLP